MAAAVSVAAAAVSVMAAAASVVADPLSVMAAAVSVVADPLSVMAALVAANHVLGTAKDVDGWDEPSHDG